jgi:hypothetical protein
VKLIVECGQRGNLSALSCQLRRRERTARGSIIVGLTPALPPSKPRRRARVCLAAM